MAGELMIGRVSMGHPSELSESRSVDSREFVLRGFIRDATKAETEATRNALLEQQGQVIAITYTLDSHYNGFYLFADVTIESMETSYLRRGLWLFEISAFRIGGEARVEFQSNITGTVLDNDYAITEINTMPFIAPPVGATLFAWETSVSRYSHTRVTEQGTIPVFINEGEFTPDATWAADPTTFYDGAVRLYVGGRLQPGLDVPSAVDDWVLTNGIIRIQPEVSGTTTGRLLIDVWDGVSAYESQKDWAFNDSADTTIGEFSFMSVVRNDPEAIIIRLSAEWTAAGFLARHTIDLNLRRGSPLVYINWHHGAANNSSMKIVRDTAEAGTVFNGFSAGQPVGLRATADDAGGNRYILVCPNTHTNDTANGGMTRASTFLLKVAVGFEINGSTAVTHNDAPRVADQYLGNIGESVRAVWR